MRFAFPSHLLAVVAAALAALSARTAVAQVADETVPTGKGVVGGALVGSEVVMLTEAALRVKPAWAYIVGGVAGAAGGGVGGYFLEQEANRRLSLYLLAGGMALAIPTTVAVLSATAYRPPRDYTQDQAPEDEPLAEPPAPDVGPLPAGALPERGEPDEGTPDLTPSAPPAPTTPESLLLRPPAPPALLALDRRVLVLHVPALEIRDVYTRRELALYGVEQETEVRVPVFFASF